MTISFDLDDTLIPGTKRFPTEPRRLFQKICGIERLRLGTILLMKKLKVDGHKVYVYTTSLRPARRIWWMFFLYGIRVDKVINQSLHETTLGSRSKDHSKYPPVFGIDVHVDDSEGVSLEGQIHHFRTIVVAEDDSDWIESVLNSIPSVAGVRTGYKE